MLHGSSARSTSARHGSAWLASLLLCTLVGLASSVSAQDESHLMCIAFPFPSALRNSPDGRAVQSACTLLVPALASKSVTGSRFLHCATSAPEGIQLPQVADQLVVMCHRWLAAGAGQFQRQVSSLWDALFPNVDSSFKDILERSFMEAGNSGAPTSLWLNIRTGRGDLIRSPALSQVVGQWFERQPTPQFMANPPPPRSAGPIYYPPPPAIAGNNCSNGNVLRIEGMRLCVVVVNSDPAFNQTSGECMVTWGIEVANIGGSVFPQQGLRTTLYLELSPLVTVRETRDQEPKYYVWANETRGSGNLTETVVSFRNLGIGMPAGSRDQAQLRVLMSFTLTSRQEGQYRSGRYGSAAAQCHPALLDSRGGEMQPKLSVVGGTSVCPAQYIQVQRNETIDCFSAPRAVNITSTRTLGSGRCLLGVQFVVVNRGVSAMTPVEGPFAVDLFPLAPLRLANTTQYANSTRDNVTISVDVDDLLQFNISNFGTTMESVNTFGSSSYFTLPLEYNGTCVDATSNTTQPLLLTMIQTRRLLNPVTSEKDVSDQWGIPSLRVANASAGPNPFGSGATVAFDDRAVVDTVGACVRPLSIRMGYNGDFSSYLYISYSGALNNQAVFHGSLPSNFNVTSSDSIFKVNRSNTATGDLSERRIVSVTLYYWPVVNAQGQNSSNLCGMDLSTVSDTTFRNSVPSRPMNVYIGCSSNAVRLEDRQYLPNTTSVLQRVIGAHVGWFRGTVAVARSGSLYIESLQITWVTCRDEEE